MELTGQDLCNAQQNAESRGTGLELAQRLNVAIDVAHAITYLHEYAERAVIHRDIRSSNVLLTGALAAKVTGFGLARMADDGPASEATHVTTMAMGTAGYVDPEYLGTLQLPDKSDVYSFGILLVELVAGRPPIERRPGLEPRATTKWAMQKFRGGEAVVAMDPRMRRSLVSVAAVEGMLRLAEQCVAPARKDRPSMRRCTEALWTLRRDYHRRQEPRQDAGLYFLYGLGGGRFVPSPAIPADLHSPAGPDLGARLMGSLHGK